MLKHSNRIPRQLFGVILKNGQSFHVEKMSLVVQKPQDMQKMSEFSCVISKKVASSAVVRNKFRRRCYSVVYKNLNKLKKGYRCVFFYKKGAEKMNFPETQDVIVKLLQKAHMFI